MLAPEHCLIQYYKHGSYYGISDMSYMHNPIPSDKHQEKLFSGTWVSVLANIISETDWLNLHDNNNFEHTFCVLQ